jgi:hypothetical protein
VLSLRDNILCAAGAKALGEGLKGNQVITELDLAGNEMGKESGAWGAKSDMCGVIALASALPDMRALTTLDISRNSIPSKQEGELQRICAAGGTKLAI